VIRMVALRAIEWFKEAAQYSTLNSSGWQKAAFSIFPGREGSPDRLAKDSFRQ
jgi:hypothetical protein